MGFPRRTFRPERKNKHEAEGKVSNEASHNLYIHQLLHRTIFKSPEMDRACSKSGREREDTELWLENLKGRPHLGDLTHSLKDIVKVDLKQREYG